MNNANLFDNIYYALTNSDSMLRIATIMMGIVLLFMILYLLFSFVRSLFVKTPLTSLRLKALDDSEKILWLDKRGTKALFNKQQKIYSKPDFITLIKGLHTVIEYKSRYGPVYESDIIQAKASAISARSNGYPISQIIVETSSGHQKKIRIPLDDDELLKEIQPYLDLARQAKLGYQLPATNNQKKCTHCSYRSSCRYQ